VRELGYDAANVDPVPASLRSDRDILRREAFAAVWHLNKLIAAHPNEASYYASRAKALVNLNDLEHALADFDRAIEGKVEGLWVECGNVHAELGHWDLAESDFRQAAQQAADTRSGARFSPIQVPLALLCLRKGDEQGYRDICRGLVPAWRSYVLSDISTLVVCHPGGVDDASELLSLVNGKNFIGLQPGTTPLAPIYYRAGRYDDALRELAWLVADENSGTAGDWFLLAMLQHRNGQGDKAQASLKRGIQRMEAFERAVQQDEDMANYTLFSAGPQNSRFGGPRGGTAGELNGWRNRIMMQALRHEAEEEMKRE
jgi:tetratricopeptide (TPR) repeat protein